jgi:hypothetical protein
MALLFGLVIRRRRSDVFYYKMFVYFIDFYRLALLIQHGLDLKRVEYTYVPNLRSWYVIM